MVNNKTTSVFQRWKKTDLLDLLEKLKINDISYQTKKPDLIRILQEHLDSLDQPLDDILEYPELQSFYEYDEPQTVSNAVEEQGEQPTGKDKKTYFNFLDFSLINKKDDVKEKVEAIADVGSTGANQESTATQRDDSDSAHEGGFKFNFQNYMNDIMEQARQLNEDVQDHLSTVYSISLICYLVEFTLLFKYQLTAYSIHEDQLDFLKNFTIWFALSFVLPSFISYYINFIRYDLPSMELDPMIFSIAKTLIAYAINNYNYQHQGMLLDSVQVGLEIWKVALGQLPFIFGVAGCVLTLYLF